MKLYLLFALFSLFTLSFATAQNTFPSSGSVGIGTTSPDASSLLDVQSTTKGLLIPRMTKAQRDAIVSPATGLLVYQTSGTKGFYSYNGSSWTQIGKPGNSWITGSGVPSSTTGLVNDLYLETATGNYYLKTTSTVWTLVGNLTGPPGAQGLQGPSGFLTPGTSAGNTPYWDGTNWVVNSANIFNKGGSVGIGSSTPATSAKLDVSSTTQGFLLPRMTTQQRNAIATPATGLQIYNLDNKLIEVYNGSSWGSSPSYTPTGTIITTPGSNSWLKKADFGGTARDGAVGFSIGSKGYIGTGYDGSNRKDFWQFDPATNTWTQKADFGGTARSYAVGFAIGSKGYIGTGTDGTFSFKKDIWEYDPSANTWIQKADFGGTARVGAAGFSIGTKGYIGTGSDGTKRKDFWEYNPVTNSWAQKADFGGTARDGAACFSTGSKGYIGTGYDGVSNKKDFWEYSPTTNSWVQKADFGGTARASAVGFAIGTKGYIGTGQDGVNEKDLWQYDPATNIWLQQADFGGAARNSAIAFALNGKGYIGTGCCSNDKDFWEYSPLVQQPVFEPTLPGGGISGPWIKNGEQIYNINTGNVGIGSATPDSSAKLEISSTNQGFLLPRMNTQQRDAIASPATGLQIYNLDNNLTEVFNGTSWGSVSASAYAPVGDPIILTGGNSWVQKADFGGSGRLDAVGFSIGSKGYVGTGNDNGNLKRDFWEYDPVTNSWTQKADFGGVARTSAVGFSIGSKGYIGTGGDGTWKKDFWEYDPVANSWTQKSDFAGIARNSAAGFSIGNKGYIGTGYNGGSYLKDFWEYDPVADSWTQKSDFGGDPIDGALGFSTANMGYLGIAGFSNKDFWQYDPVTDHWTQKATFTGENPRNAKGFSIGSKIYVATGFDLSFTLRKDLWEYDPVMDNWTQKADLAGEGRSSAVAFSIGNTGYIGLGKGTGGQQLTDFWAYTPDATAQVYQPVLPAGGITGLWESNGSAIYNVNDGNVGIGTMSPGGQLELSKDEGRKPGTSTWTIVSDERLKKIDGDYTKGLDDLLLLKPIRFHYHSAGGRTFDRAVMENEYAGFSAQAVQKIFPEAINTGDDGYLNFNMHPILVAQVNAIRELNEKVEAIAPSGSNDSLIYALQEQVAALQKSNLEQQQVNADLNQKLDALLNQVNSFELSLSKCCTVYHDEQKSTGNSDMPSLGQNIPNPFTQTSYIKFYIPSSAKSGGMIIYDHMGSIVKQFTGLQPGYGTVSIDNGLLSAGTYQYTLFIDGKPFDTKQMIVVK